MTKKIDHELVGEPVKFGEGVDVIRGWCIAAKPSHKRIIDAHTGNVYTTVQFQIKPIGKGKPFWTRPYKHKLLLEGTKQKLKKLQEGNTK